MSGGPALVLAAGALSVVELDTAAAGLFMLSRPIVLGPILGLAFSQPELGTALGLLWELLSLDALPIGGNLPLNASVAAGASLLMALGPAAAPPELALPAGFAFGWTHARLETRLRRRRDGLGRLVEERLERGLTPGLGALVGRELLKQAGMTFAVLLAALLARLVFFWAWPALPELVQAGLRTGLLLSPWIAGAALVHAFKAAW